MEALTEWVTFTNTYDQDGTILIEADGTGSEWELPGNYHLTYGCYSQEMVDKLDEIVNKYHLKLLSSYIPLNYYESSVLLNSLGLKGLVKTDPDVQVEYWDGDFHIEGTFTLNMEISLDMGDWSWEQGSASYRYSLKDYFDPLTGSMLESHDYTQWDYTRKDGKKVLLVLNEGTARIYANLPKAFISIYLDPVICVDGNAVSMTQEALQQQRRQSRVCCEHSAIKVQRGFLPHAQQRRQRKADQKRRGNGSGGGDTVLPDIGAV